MSKPKNGQKPETAVATYDERIAPQKKLATTKHVNNAIRHLENSEGKLIEGGRCLIQSVEEMRLAGVEWLRGSEKGQYDLYFYDYIEGLVKLGERKILTREIVKTAIHFANVIPEPIKDLQMAMPFVQKIGNAFAMLRKNKRGIEQAHIPPSLFAEFASVAKTACAKLRRLEEHCPISTMDEIQLDVLINEFLPVYECVGKAIQLRKQKVIAV